MAKIKKVVRRKNPLDNLAAQQELDRLHLKLDNWINRGFISRIDKKRILDKANTVNEQTFNFLDKKIGGNYAGKCALLAEIGSISNQISDLER